MKCFLLSISISGLGAMVSTPFFPDQVSGLVFLIAFIAFIASIAGLALPRPRPTRSTP